MRRLLREPLLHFLLLGALLFACARALSPPDPASRRLAVTAEVIEGLRRDHQRRSGRSPSADETRALVDRYVESELLYREALALGLDRGDVIVRRRLVQKMELLAGLEGEPALPGEAELQAELAARPDRYRQPARVAFEHVFVSRDGHGEADAEATADRLRARLLDGAEPARLGDPFLRGAVQPLLAEPEISGVFGPDFAAAVIALPDGAWSRPLPSSFGLHLVRVTAREPGRALRLEEVRDRVVEAVRARHHEEARQAALQRLRARYAVEVAPIAVAASPVDPGRAALAEAGR